MYFIDLNKNFDHCSFHSSEFWDISVLDRQIFIVVNLMGKRSPLFVLMRKGPKKKRKKKQKKFIRETNSQEDVWYNAGKWLLWYCILKEFIACLIGW